jgi:hypothetical protein
LVFEHGLYTRLLITPTGSPHRRGMTLHPSGNFLHPFAVGNGQHNPRSLDLTPRHASAPSKLFQHRTIISS